MATHSYSISLRWTGNKGEGTVSYTSYGRDHVISGQDKYEALLCSSDPSFRGDRSRYNPEELFLSSLSSCHMLWYLHFCSVNHITVMSYEDRATGVMEESADGNGRFTEVCLHPVVLILENKQELAAALHHQANEFCFIANSCNFKVKHAPKIIIRV